MTNNLLAEVASMVNSLGFPNEKPKEEVKSKESKKTTEKSNPKSKVVESKVKKFIKTEASNKNTKMTTKDNESTHFKKNQVLPIKKKLNIQENESKKVNSNHVRFDGAPAPAPVLKQARKLLIDTAVPWYHVKLTELNVESLDKPTFEMIGRMEAKAAQLYAQELEAYEKFKPMASGDLEWYNTVLRSGTVTDRIAALTLRARSSGAHHILDACRTLLNMGQKKSRREALLALDALKDLLQSIYLPKDRKLVYFKHQPVQHPAITPLHLITWHVEDQLKHLYFEFLQLIEQLAQDPLTFCRHKIVTILFDLLVEHPEQEQNLLNLLVNKLGDPENKIASRASYLLLQVLVKHPNMKSIVVNEVREFMHRPKTTVKAQYYAMIFLNQILLSKKEGELANTLMHLYLDRFGQWSARGDLDDTQKVEDNEDSKADVKTKVHSKNTNKPEEPVESEASRLMTALLTGVHRAYPYATLESDVYTKHLDTLFRMTHTGPFTTSVQAMTLIHQMSESQQSISDRFYRALYAMLFDPRLRVTSTKVALFFNILYKALEADSVVERVQAFVKRLLQTCLMQSPPFICASLVLVSEVFAKNSKARSFISTMKQGATKEAESAETYDALKRDPLFAGAQWTCLWELVPLARHCHPTVAKYATALLKGEAIECFVNPLQTYTLARFLDRFITKHAKTGAAGDHGSSWMQPRGDVLPFVQIAAHRLAKENASTALSQEALSELNEGQVPETDLFFYRYLKQSATQARMQSRQLARQLKREESEMQEGHLDDSFEEEVDRFLDGHAVDDEADDEALEGLEEELDENDLDVDQDSDLDKDDDDLSDELSVSESDLSEDEEEDENPLELPEFIDVDAELPSDQEKVEEHSENENSDASSSEESEEEPSKRSAKAAANPWIKKARSLGAPLDERGRVMRGANVFMSADDLEELVENEDGYQDGEHGDNANDSDSEDERRLKKRRNSKQKENKKKRRSA